MAVTIKDLGRGTGVAPAAINADFNGGKLRS